jgi:hypothetical protein
MLSVIYAGCHLCKLSVTNKPSMLSAILLSVANKRSMLSVMMLSVANKPSKLYVIKLNVAVLSVVEP